jgi:hypothetical protein
MATSSTFPDLLTAAETAQRRRRTTQALAMERRRGAGPPYIRDGSRILYPRDELEQWLKDHRVDPALQHSTASGLT